MHTLTHHVRPMVIESPQWPKMTVPSFSAGTEFFVHSAGHAARLLPAIIHDALVDFADSAHRSGALLLRGLPVGELPRTPPTPTTPADKDSLSEFTLLTVARRLGQPVGYEPEHGGDLVQNIVPTETAVDRQISTSSKVQLMFHTEAAFHPYRPRYLLLLCLRGDPAAQTTLASIFEVMPQLAADVIDVLFPPRFRTAVAESYLHGRSNVLGAPMAVLTGDRRRPSMVFDADLMVGVDEQADDALCALGDATAARHASVALEAGDLLVVDNAVAVHGRTPFAPRFDGTDRWVQRTFVVSDLAPSAADRRDRMITTRFGV
ncbi:MAG: TauD/TfdA family dioxygenase [Actinomycetota bacterium]|nr:TauD/TfdA family dioxygenase [Actinomycetota bacterium]